jgi:hypothetical protein
MTKCGTEVGLGSAAQHFAPRCVPGTPKNHPRPTNGILLAMTVMNSTLASSGRLAM